MTLIITIIATDATLSDLRCRLDGIEGVKQSDLDDWNSAGSSLDAPFNPWRAGERLQTLTVELPDAAQGVLIKQLVDAYFATKG